MKRTLSIAVALSLIICPVGLCRTANAQDIAQDVSSDGVHGVAQASATQEDAAQEGAPQYGAYAASLTFGSMGADEGSLQAGVAETLDRGLVATAATGGVNDGIYLSWRLLGGEAVNNQSFDVYRNGEKIATTGRSDPTTFVDSKGTNSDTYQVVKEGAAYQAGHDVSVWTNVGTDQPQTSIDKNIVNSYAYLDINFDRPPNTQVPNIETDGNGNKTVTYTEITYTANDASVADLDNDGVYELVIKWAPSNSRDNSDVGLTSPTLLDAYDVNYSTGEATRMWRIDLGCNIRSGAHFNPFMVYDFDQDGIAELAVKTAPGTLDGAGNYVTMAGDTDEIRNADNTATYYSKYEEVNGEQIPTRGNIMSGPEYLTLFNGNTGAAISTVDYWPARDIVDFGDNYGNRSERYLASVAYLDGVTPTLIMHRGYYTSSFAAAYQYDGTSFKRIWIHSSLKDGSSVTYSDGTTVRCDKTLYGQGFHNLSVGDIDDDGCDEVIYGSAVLDHDGTVLTSSGRGHGDAQHSSDFDNDGSIEMFDVHEDSKTYSIDLRRYNTETGQEEDLALRPFPDVDVGRGIMDNFDDEYAQKHTDASAIFWSSAENGAFDTKGNEIGTKPDTSGNFVNAALYWDGDLSREMLDGTKLEKYSVEGTNRRFMFGKLSYFPEVSSNNSTKQNPCLQADILGDWREEVIFRKADNTGVRLFMSTIPTDYRIPTLMSDHMYRLAITWQNNGYNQPPHTGYYIGGLSVAKDQAGNDLGYLDPKIPAGVFDTESTSMSSTSVDVTVQKDTYLTPDKVAHGQETSMLANQGEYTTYNIPGMNKVTSVAYMTFDVSKYLDTSKYEISAAKVRLNYKMSSNSSTQLFIGHATKDDYDEATFCSSDVAFRNANTPLEQPFASQWLRPIADYQPYEFDVLDELTGDADGKLSLYCYTGSARMVEISTKEGAAELAPTLVLTLKAKQADDPLNEIPVLASEQHTLVHHGAVAATCTETGTVEYWQCSTCKKRFSDDEGINELTAADTIVPSLGHAWGNWVATQPATCTADGVETRTCTRDSSHVETRTTEALGHDWGNAAYTWSGDNSSVKAKAVCTHDASHVESATASTTYAVVVEPTETEAGTGLYTAVFSSPFETQQKQVVLPATGQTTEEGNVTGTVTAWNGNAVAGVQVGLQKGDVTIAGPVVTGSDGSYSFNGILPGIYNIIVKVLESGVAVTTTTAIVEVGEDATHADLKLPSKQGTNSMLEVEDGAPAVSVGGLDGLAEIVRGAEEAAASGSTVTSVTVKMTVTAESEQDASGAAEIRAEAEKSLGGKRAGIDFFDVALEKTVSLNGGGKATEPIEEAAAVITLAVPFDISGHTNVGVCRYHADTASALTEILAKPAAPDACEDGTFYLDGDLGAVYIYASKFSEYAIVYESDEPGSEGGSSGSEGSGSEGSGGESGSEGSGSEGSGSGGSDEESGSGDSSSGNSGNSGNSGGSEGASGSEGSGGSAGGESGSGGSAGESGATSGSDEANSGNESDASTSSNASNASIGAESSNGFDSTGAPNNASGSSSESTGSSSSPSSERASQTQQSAMPSTGDSLGLFAAVLFALIGAGVATAIMRVARFKR